MDNWMMLQAQVHQGQSHFATTPTRPQEPGDAPAGPHHAQQQQQPPVTFLPELSRAR